MTAIHRGVRSGLLKNGIGGPLALSSAVEAREPGTCPDFREAGVDCRPEASKGDSMNDWAQGAGVSEELLLHTSRERGFDLFGLEFGGSPVFGLRGGNRFCEFMLGGEWLGINMSNGFSMTIFDDDVRESVGSAFDVMQAYVDGEMYVKRDLLGHELLWSRCDGFPSGTRSRRSWHWYANGGPFDVTFDWSTSDSSNTDFPELYADLGECLRRSAALDGQEVFGARWGNLSTFGLAAEHSRGEFRLGGDWLEVRLSNGLGFEVYGHEPEQLLTCAVQLMSQFARGALFKSRRALHQMRRSAVLIPTSRVHPSTRKHQWYQPDGPCERAFGAT